MTQQWEATCSLSGFLTAFNGMRGNLKRQELASRLWNMNTKYQTHTSVFSSNVCFTIPQLDVGVSQFQDPYTVNPEKCRTSQIKSLLWMLSPCFIQNLLHCHLPSDTVQLLRQYLKMVYQIKSYFVPSLPATEFQRFIIPYVCHGIYVCCSVSSWSFLGKGCDAFYVSVWCNCNLLGAQKKMTILSQPKPSWLRKKNHWNFFIGKS